MKPIDQIQKELAAPFDPAYVESRTDKKSGRMIFWIKAPTAMQRFDDVVGIANWRPIYKPVDRGIECTIELYFDELGWIAKSDVGGFPGMEVKDQDGTYHTDNENDLKGGYSDAFKRAASAWGVGRYLRLPGFRPLDHIPTSNGQASTPRPTAASSPSSTRPAATSERPSSNGNGHAQRTGVPRDGKRLFGWIKDQDKVLGADDLIKYINGWARLQDFPGRMIDWSERQVEQAYREALRKLEGYIASEKAYQEAISNG